MQIQDKILELSLPLLFIQTFYLAGVDRFLMTGLTVYCIFLSVYLPVKKIWTLFEDSIYEKEGKSEQDDIEESATISVLHGSAPDRRVG